MIIELLLLNLHMLHDNFREGEQTTSTNIPEYESSNTIAIKGNGINLGKQ